MGPRLDIRCYLCCGGSNRRHPILIVLTTYEEDLARLVGQKRWEESRRQGRVHSRGLREEDSRLDYDIEGAAGEIAAARALNRYWHGSVNAPKLDPDIGHNIQVRTTARENGRLIVGPDDPPDQLYVLVVGQMPRYRVVGAIRGREAMREEYLANPGNRKPAYFVPQDALKPIEK